MWTFSREQKKKIIIITLGKKTIFRSVLHDSNILAERKKERKKKTKTTYVRCARVGKSAERGTKNKQQAVKVGNTSETKVLKQRT